MTAMRLRNAAEDKRQLSKLMVVQLTAFFEVVVSYYLSSWKPGFPCLWDGRVVLIESRGGRDLAPLAAIIPAASGTWEVASLGTYEARRHTSICCCSSNE